MIKKIFRKIMPTLRMEAGCALSLVSVFLFLEYGGHVALVKLLSDSWQAGEIGQWSFNLTLLVVGVLGVLLPFASCVIGYNLHRRFAALSLAFSVVVLACAEGWLASEAIRRLVDSPGVWGMSFNGILAAVSFFELGILIYGGFSVLEDQMLLTTLIGKRRVDWTLLAFNILTTGITLVLFRVWFGMAPAEAALLAMHLVFAITWFRAPLDSNVLSSEAGREAP